MIAENIGFISFLLTALLAVSACLWWLVKKIIHITTNAIKENTESNKDLRNAISNSVQATNELKQIIINKL